MMAEAAHGTAPSLEGKNVANPMAMILAGAALLSHGGETAQRAGRAIREACLEAVAAGARTADLGGHLGTSEFTDEVIARVRREARGLGVALAGRPRRDRVARARSAHTSKNASAMTGSNCEPGARASISAVHRSVVQRGAVRPAEIIASNASATPSSRASSGNRTSAKTAGIAAAVPPLVMEEHVRERIGRAAERQHELGARRADAPGSLAARRA